MFKKSILVLIVAVLAVLAYGTLSTGAWFTDQEVVGPTVVVAGTLDLKVDTYGAMRLEKLEPGADYQTIGYFCAQNVGDFDMKWKGTVEIIAGNANLAPYLGVKVIMNPEGYDWDNGVNYGPSVATDLFAKHGFTDVRLDDLVAGVPPILMHDADWDFEPGSVACYALQVALAEDTPDTMKTQWLQAKLTLDATQLINDDVAW